jgi:tetratricopeptide (TPR) repeat protein
MANERWDDGMARLALRCVGLHVPSTNALQYWVTQQRLLRHANQCHGFVDAVLARQEDDMTMMGAVHGLGLLYADQGKLGKAEGMYERALQAYEKAIGRDHTSTLDTVGNLGNLYKDQGKLDKADGIYERALQGYEKYYGFDHPRCRSLRRALVALKDCIETG